MECLRMMVVDGDAAYQRALSEYFAKFPRITIVATAGDGEEAIRLTKDVCPDTVVLDLILPKSDGFFYLENIHHLPGKKPNVIVASAAVNDRLISRAMAYGASFFMAKPLDYHMLSQRILEFGWSDLTASDNFREDMRAESRASRILSQAGMPVKMHGFDFLIAAMRLIDTNPDMIYNITKELYPSIAKNCNTLPKNVEHSIRNAIDVMWKRGALKEKLDLFNLDTPLTKKPTNGEFIALLSNSLKYGQHH